VRLAILRGLLRLNVGPLGSLPPPQAEKIVTVPLEEVEVAVVVEERGRIIARSQPVAIILSETTTSGSLATPLAVKC